MASIKWSDAAWCSMVIVCFLASESYVATILKMCPSTVYTVAHFQKRPSFLEVEYSFKLTTA